MCEWRKRLFVILWEIKKKKNQDIRFETAEKCGWISRHPSRNEAGGLPEARNNGKLSNRGIYWRKETSKSGDSSMTANAFVLMGKRSAKMKNINHHLWLTQHGRLWLIHFAFTFSFSFQKIAYVLRKSVTKTRLEWKHGNNITMRAKASREIIRWC